MLTRQVALLGYLFWIILVTSTFTTCKADLTGLPTNNTDNTPTPTTISNLNNTDTPTPTTNPNLTTTATPTPTPTSTPTVVPLVPSFPPGCYLSFDGVGGYVVFPSLSLNSYDSWSINVWLLLNGSQCPSSEQEFIRQENHVSFNIIGGNYLIWLHQQGWASILSVPCQTQHLNTWTMHTITYSRNQSMLSYYINGVFASNHSMTLALSASSYPLELGALSTYLDGSYPQHLYSGSMHDVRVWSVALNMSNLVAEYQQGTAQVGNALLRNYMLNDCTPGILTVNDSTTYQQTGILKTAFQGRLPQWISNTNNTNNTTIPTPTTNPTTPAPTVSPLVPSSPLSPQCYLSFDGVGGYVILPSLSLNSYDSWSINVWLLMNGSQCPSSEQEFIRQENHVSFNIIGGNYLIWVHQQGWASVISVPCQTPHLNTWTMHTITYSRNQSVLSYYINGLFAKNSSGTLVLSSSTYPLELGALSTNLNGSYPQHLYSGSMHDVRVWSVALNISDLAVELQGYTAQPGLRMIRNYVLNDCTQGQLTVIDQTSYNQTGILKTTFQGRLPQWISNINNTATPTPNTNTSTLTPTATPTSTLTPTPTPTPTPTSTGSSPQSNATFSSSTGSTPLSGIPSSSVNPIVSFSSLGRNNTFPNQAESHLFPSLILIGGMVSLTTWFN